MNKKYQILTCSGAIELVIKVGLLRYCTMFGARYSCIAEYHYIFISFGVLVLCPVFGICAHSIPNSEKFSVHFLSKQETQNIIVKKCCAPSEALEEDGTCTRMNFEPHNLGTRITRAIKDVRNESYQEETVVIGFLHSRPTCQDGMLQRLSFSVHSDELQMTAALQFVTNEFLENTEAQNESLLIDPRDYCIDWKSQESITVEFCLHQSCISLLQEITTSAKHNISSGFSYPGGFTAARPPCLRKCCPPSQVLDMESFTCVKYDIPWQLSPMQAHLDNTMNFPLDEPTFPQSGIPLQASWLTGTPNCEQSYEVYVTDYDRYYITKEGVLITQKLDTFAKTQPGEYCFDAVLQKRNFFPLEYENDARSNGSRSRADISRKTDTIRDILMFSKQMALVCFEETVTLDKENDFTWRIVYTILTGVSCIFLLITCIIYAILNKDLNLPGWLQFAYAFALLLTFTLLTVAQLWTQRIHDISKSLCRALGYGLHFFFLSCFIWLTSMNLDLWLSFRSSALARGFGKSRGKRRFFEFTAFSIGFPIAITLLVFAVDSITPKQPHLQGGFWVLPTSGIGEDSCVIRMGNKVAQLHYFYGFVGLLLLVNLVIFICTLISLRNRERETRMAKRQSTSNSDYDRNGWFKLNRLQLFTRLFLIMGILWIFEVISWLVEFFDVGKNIRLLFNITDCLNALQGVAVFLMFIWKRQTWKQLKKKYKSMFGMRGARPLSRPSYNCTVSSNGVTKSSSVKSSHLSSTKSTNSSCLPSTSTVTTFENDVFSK